MSVQILLRRGTASQWDAAGSTVLGAGEPGFETDTGKLKIGDGVSPWTSLSYVAGQEAIALRDLSDVASTLPSNGQVLSWNGTSWAPATVTASSTVQSDTSPKLGGSLDVNGYSIISSNNGNINLAPNGTGKVLITSPVQMVSNAAVDVIRDGSSTLSSPVMAITSYSTANGTLLNFNRYSGTFASPSPVTINDTLGRIFFNGWDGTSLVIGAGITSTIDDVVSTGIIKSDIKFLTNKGSGLGISALISSSGILKIDSIQALTTNGSLNLSGNGTGVVALPAGSTVGGSPIATVAGGGTAYSISSSSTAGGANLTLSGSDSSVDSVTLAAGTNVSITSTDANTITISATSGGGGGSLPARTDKSIQTGPISDNSTASVNITNGYKTYALLKVHTSAAAWVRIYTSEAARIADGSRAQGVDPSPGAGVIAEVITTGEQFVSFSPATIGFSDELTPNETIPMAITNKSGNTIDITVTITILQMEA